MAVHLRGYNPERELRTLEGKAHLRMHIAKNFVGVECGFCHKPYIDVDDFIARDPKRGRNGDTVDAKCWKHYDRFVQGGDGFDVET